MEERHQVEIKVYKQKVKHLLYEHQNSITQLKTDLEMATKLLQDEHRVCTILPLIFLPLPC